MKKLLGVLIALVVIFCFPGVSFAQHPGTPLPTVTPSSTPAEEQPSAHPVFTANQVIAAIKDHINRVMNANNGIFPLYDPVDKTNLRLLFVKIHEDKVSYIKKHGAYFACSDFKTEDGKTKYDIDFWMKKNREGNLEVFQTRIHKKNGVPRFYYMNDEIVEVK